MAQASFVMDEELWQLLERERKQRKVSRADVIRERLMRSYIDDNGHAPAPVPERQEPVQS